MDIDAFVALLKEHDAEYTGIQQGIGDVADMLVFRDSVTGTSLAIPLADVTPHSIREKLVIARAKFGF